MLTSTERPPTRSRKQTSARRQSSTLETGFVSISAQHELCQTVATGVRVPVTAFVGATEWAQFHVDLVGADLHMTGEPKEMPALTRVAMPDVEQHGYRVYPLVDHVADKVAAIIERHGEGDHASTRFKDLVDLVAIVTRDVSGR